MLGLSQILFAQRLCRAAHSKWQKYGESLKIEGSWGYQWRHENHCCGAVDCCEGDVFGVTTGCDAHKVVDGGHVSGVKKHPLTTKIGLEDRVKIWGWVIKIRISDDQPSRDIDGAAKGDAKVREIAANTGAVCQRIACGGHGVGSAYLVVDVFGDPVDDGFNAVYASGQLSKHRLGDLAETIGLAKSCWVQVVHEFIRQVVNG